MESFFKSYKNNTKTRISNFWQIIVKTLRLFSTTAHQLRGLKHFTKLSVLELTVPLFDNELLNSISEACFEICLTRALNPNPIPFRVRSDEKFIQSLKAFIVRYYVKVLNNLQLFVRVSTKTYPLLLISTNK